MDFHGLDLNQLVVLDVLLEERNITRTGKRIHLCQSATSCILGKLREFFSDELLVQVGRSMVLTPLAEDLILPVREVLQQAQLLIDRSQVFTPSNSRRRYRIVLSDYVETVLAATVLRRIEREAPSVSIELLPFGESVAETLERGEIDFLIAPDNEISPSHPSVSLFKDTYVCVFWSGNRLIGDSISFDQYMNLGHIGINFGKGRYHSWDEALMAQKGFKRRVEVIVSSFGVMANYLVGTSRIATMHRRLADHYQKLLPLRIVELPFAMPPLTEKLQWHQYLDKTPNHRWLRSIFLEEASRMDAGPAFRVEKRIDDSQIRSEEPELTTVQ
jgi:LysR family transcriptional regulator, nod-box dependent transcriptional activator